MSETELSNYHVHCFFCDGSGTPDEIIQKAITANIKYLGFSSHAPVPFSSDWNMPFENLNKYISYIKSLRNRLNDNIQVFVGLEIDFIEEFPDLNPDSFRVKGIEYFIGSVHYLGTLPSGSRWTVDGSENEFRNGLEFTFHNDIQKLISAYFKKVVKMAVQWQPDIIAHFDLVKKNNTGSKYFDENQKWYRSIVADSLRNIARTGCILEINTGGLLRKKINDLYPSQWILEECFRNNMNPV